MDSRTISRRETLGTLGATGMLALAGCVGEDDDGDDGSTDTNGTTDDDAFDGLRIGVLGALTGDNGPEFGLMGITGFLSGLAYKADDDPLTHPALEYTDNGLTAASTIEPPEAIHGEVMEYTVNDVDMELHFRDSADDPDTADEQAVDLVGNENVDVLFGLSNSDSLLRVITNVIPVDDTPLFVGQATTSDATADAQRCDRRVFRATETSAMSARAGSAYIVDNPDIERVALYGADYSFGRSVIEHYRTALEDAGIEIVTADEDIDEIVSQGFADWEEKLQTEVVDADADAIVYGFTAQTGVPFFRDYASLVPGLAEPLQVIGDLPPRISTNELGESFEVLIEQQLGEGDIDPVILETILNTFGFGPLTARYMWNQYDNPINDAFVEMHTEAYNVVPDLFTSSAFTSASAIVQALEESGEVSSDAILEETYGMTVEATPKGEGEYVFQEANNQATSPITVTDLTGNIHGEEGTEAYWPPIIRAGTEDELAEGGDWMRVEKEETALQADEVTCDLDAEF